jgi:hypothetical protein
MSSISTDRLIVTDIPHAAPRTDTSFSKLQKDF